MYMQDILRLINLLFQFGHLPEIREVAREGLGKIRLQNWLPVLQQLLARIDTPHEHVANIIVDLLIAVGRQFPQALIYSLVLSFKSGGSDRRRYYATKILYFMEEHSPRLVYEAFLVSELLRVSYWLLIKISNLTTSSPHLAVERGVDTSLGVMDGNVV